MTIKLFIATLVDGNPETATVHMHPMILRQQLGGVVREYGYAVGDVRCGNTDVSRGRDRLARLFLEGDCTHCLWWDEDVVPRSLNIIPRMLSIGHDVIAAPVPRKKYPTNFSYRLNGPDGQAMRVEVVNGCVEVDAIAFGFMITSRAAIEKMVKFYSEERWYYDIYAGAQYRTVGIFDLLYTPVEDMDGTPFRVKLSEDYSFCESWRSIGGKVWMYLGDGNETPGHIGNHIFAGDLEVLSRQT